MYTTDSFWLLLLFTLTMRLHTRESKDLLTNNNLVMKTFEENGFLQYTYSSEMLYSKRKFLILFEDGRAKKL